MLHFESNGLRGGGWSGTLTADAQPSRVFLTQHGEILSFARLKADGEGRWQVTVDVPASALSDGVHSLVLVADNGEGNAAPLPGSVRLEHLTIAAGQPLDEDLTAEIALIRAELELLKREFRRFATREETDA